MARKNKPTDAQMVLKFQPVAGRNGTGRRAGSDRVGKRVVFDLATWQSLDLLARERRMTFQELADEAFRDVLRKHGRPSDTRDALRRSARLAQANENKADTPAPKSKRPARGRARS